MRGLCNDENVGGYGDENNPLCEIPRNLAAGSVVEIHGGPYSYTSARIDIKSAGSPGMPVFVRGFDSNDRTEFMTGYFTLSGQYLILENVYVYNTGISIRDPDGGDTHHISVRNNEVEGGGAGHSGGNGISASSGVLTDYIVMYNNHVHHEDAHLPQP